MPKLTIARIRKLIAKHPDKIDQEIDIVEDTVGIWTKQGFAWDVGEARHVEIVKIGDYYPDDTDYLKECITSIGHDPSEY